MAASLDHIDEFDNFLVTSAKGYALSIGAEVCRRSQFPREIWDRLIALVPVSSTELELPLFLQGMAWEYPSADNEFYAVALDRLLADRLLSHYVPKLETYRFLSSDDMERFRRGVSAHPEIAAKFVSEYKFSSDAYPASVASLLRSLLSQPQTRSFSIQLLFHVLYIDAPDRPGFSLRTENAFRQLAKDSIESCSQVEVADAIETSLLDILHWLLKSDDSGNFVQAYFEGQRNTWATVKPTSLGFEIMARCLKKFPNTGLSSFFPNGDNSDLTFVAARWHDWSAEENPFRKIDGPALTEWCRDGPSTRWAIAANFAVLTYRQRDESEWVVSEGRLELSRQFLCLLDECPDQALVFSTLLDRLAAAFDAEPDANCRTYLIRLIERLPTFGLDDFEDAIVRKANRLEDKLRQQSASS